MVARVVPLIGFSLSGYEDDDDRRYDSGEREQEPNHGDDDSEPLILQSFLAAVLFLGVYERRRRAFERVQSFPCAGCFGFQVEHVPAYIE
jgi:hypothetical protein